MKHLSPLMLFTAAAFAVPMLAAQDETDDKKPEPKEKAVVRPSETVVRAGDKFFGKITDVRTEEKEVVVILPDPKKLQDFAVWKQKQIAEIYKKPDPGRVQKYKNDLPKKMMDVFSGETRTLELSDIVRVRTEAPPQTFDDKGTPIKIPSSQLYRYKSTMLPGYTANASALKTGQMVEVTIPRAGPAPKAAQQPAAKKDFIGVDPNLTVGGAGGPKIPVLMIYIHADGN